MSKICALIVLVALLAAFVILFITKTGFRENMRNKADIKGFTLIGDMLDCDFCLSFWIIMVISVILAMTFNSLFALLIPFFAAPITRILI